MLAPAPAHTPVAASAAPIKNSTPNPKMRSSIACTRCRKSKIKCENNGVETTCRACQVSGRQCGYPTPASSASAQHGGGSNLDGGQGHNVLKRDNSASADIAEQNGLSYGFLQGGGQLQNEQPPVKRQRAKKGVVTTPLYASTSAGDSVGVNTVLDHPALTSRTWESLFEQFQMNFATLLPFVHPSVIHIHMRTLITQQGAQHNQQQQQFSPATQGFAQEPGDFQQSKPSSNRISPLILLGVLTLTARFHPSLVQLPTGDHNANAASDVYAAELRARLFSSPALWDPQVEDLTHVQALLMLTLHEWTMGRQKRAWMYIGTAVRMALAMGLAVETPGNSENDGACSQANGSTSNASSGNQACVPDALSEEKVIEMETRRRTFWACFTLDRCLSSGSSRRPRMLCVRDAQVPLPSDNAFMFGEKVGTARLGCLCDRSARKNHSCQGCDGDRKGVSDRDSDRAYVTAGIDRLEIGADECALSRLIRIVRLWTKISRWACRNSNHSNPASESALVFSSFQSRLAEFQRSLPRNLQHTHRNTETHIFSKRTLPPYALMHSVYFASLIILHRGSLPVLPLRSKRPMGPMDGEAREESHNAATPSSHPCADKASASSTDQIGEFYAQSAATVFRAARNILDLTRSCYERGAMAEHPLIAFSLYQACLVGVYATRFSGMDQEHAVSDNSSVVNPVSPDNAQSGSANRGPDASTPAVELCHGLEILADMRLRVNAAEGLFRTVNRLHSYYGYARSVIGERPGFNTRRQDAEKLDRLFARLGHSSDQINSCFGKSHVPLPIIVEDAPRSRQQQTLVTKSEPDMHQDDQLLSSSEYTNTHPKLPPLKPATLDSKPSHPSSNSSAEPPLFLQRYTPNNHHQHLPSIATLQDQHPSTASSHTPSPPLSLLPLHAPGKPAVPPTQQTAATKPTTAASPSPSPSSSSSSSSSSSAPDSESVLPLFSSGLVGDDVLVFLENDGPDSLGDDLQWRQHLGLPLPGGWMGLIWG